MATRVFRNTLPERLADELAIAARLGVVPTRPGEPDFGNVATAGTTKWAVTVDGELVLIPKVVRGEEIAQTVLTNGAPVLAAGEVEVVEESGVHFIFDLTNHSGHYQPEAASRRIGIRAFANAGIELL